jgi:hypothetical protein
MQAMYNHRQLGRILLLILIVTSIFSTVFAQKKRTAHKQGIEGVVIWKAGNLQPSPDAPTPTNQGTPISREIWIVALTNTQKTPANEEGFYPKLNQKVIARVVSDKNGKFRVRLKPGYYSIFTKEKQGFWANQLDDANNIYPVKVERNRFEKINFVIDYQATY